MNRMSKINRTCQVMGAALLLFVGHALAQSTINATTEDGRKVILSQDGTWQYVSPSNVIQGTEAASSTYTKPKTATKVLTINKGAASLSYDPQTWIVSTDASDPNRTNFSHKSGDIYGIVIAERLGLSPDALMEIVLENAKKASTALTVRERGKRVVNGDEVTYMMFEPTIQGIEFIFEGYYYAGPAGSIQVIAYIGKNLHPEYKQEIENFLNGFAISPKSPAQ